MMTAVHYNIQKEKFLAQNSVVSSESCAVLHGSLVILLLAGYSVRWF